MDVNRKPSVLFPLITKVDEVAVSSRLHPHAELRRRVETAQKITKRE